MKNESRSLWPAVVEVAKVKFSKGKDLGIDFSNEIDAWAKMEFKYRHQINHLKKYGKANEQEVRKDLKSLVYAIREKIEV